MKRLFVAITVSPDLDFLRSFRLLRQTFSHEKINWVDEQHIHITVKFLGETPEQKLPGISALIRVLARQTTGFTYTLSGCGIFGSRYNPRVIWTGLRPSEPFSLLMSQARKEFAEIGFPSDRQNLVPHLTLGRIKNLKDPQGFQPKLDRFRTLSSSPMQAVDLVLFESILRPEGPTYVSLAVEPFLTTAPGG